MSLRGHPTVITVAAYLLGVVVFGVLIGSFNLPRYSRLEAHGADARAVVTATACDDHMSVAYEFKVGDRVYQGRGGDGYGNPGCRRLKPGDPVRVRYLVADPRESLPGSIDDRLRNEWQSVALGALFLPLAAVVVARRWWKRRAEARP